MLGQGKDITSKIVFHSCSAFFCMPLNTTWCGAMIAYMLNFSHLSSKWSTSEKNKMFIATWRSFLQGTGSHNSVIIFIFWFNEHCLLFKVLLSLSSEFRPS
jgi:hypothetical protein